MAVSPVLRSLANASFILLLVTGCTNTSDGSLSPAPTAPADNKPSTTSPTEAAGDTAKTDRAYTVGPDAKPAGVQACQDMDLDALLLNAIGPSTLEAADSVPGSVSCVFTIPTETTDKVALNMLEVSFEENPAVPYDIGIRHLPGGTEFDLGDRAYMGTQNARPDIAVYGMLVEIDGALLRVNGIFEPTNTPVNWNTDAQEALARKALNHFTR